MQVRSQALDDFCAPAGAILTFEDIAADVPVEESKLAVDRDGRSHLGSANALLQIPQKRFVVDGKQTGRWFFHERER